MEKDVRDLILTAIEDSLDAQLRSVRRLRQGPSDTARSSTRKRMSQVDMAYDILSKCRAPLHISEILARIHSSFGIRVDRESLVSSLTKKVARGDRFLRTAANTFSVRRETP